METLPSSPDAAPEWPDLTAGKSFIVDRGEQQPEMWSTLARRFVQLPRFAVFKPVPDEAKHQIVAVGDDLEQLRHEHQVSPELVLQLRH